MTRCAQAAVTLSSKVITTVCALALAACASGAASGGIGGSSSPALSYGYMIPGAHVATTLGVAPTDTIPELTARTTVPTTVANAITQEVAQGKWNNKCTRRFGGPAAYAVIFHRACDSALGPDADPVVIVAFSADGRTRGRVPWTGLETVSALVPARRF